MNNHFKLGKPLNVIWHFKRPDGENYSLAGLQHELVCYNSRGRFKIKDSVINVEDTGVLSFTLKEEMQTVEGAYSFHLSLLRHGKTVNTIVKNDAIILSKHIIDTDSIQEDEPTTINIFSVGEFELFRPTAPVADSDGWWYFNGQPILDDEGNKVPINVTIDIIDDPEDQDFGLIILDKSRDGDRERVIYGLRDTIKKVVEQGNTTEAQGIEAERQGNVAESQGNVAEEQGNVAEAQGLTAKAQGEKAEQQGNIAEQKGSYAAQLGNTAEAQGNTAKQRGEKAEQQGNITEAQGNQAVLIATDKGNEAISIAQTAANTANTAAANANTAAQEARDGIAEMVTAVENAKDDIIKEVEEGKLAELGSKMGISSNIELNGYVKEIYCPDLDYTQVNEVKINLGTPTGNKYYNSVYLFYLENGARKSKNLYQKEYDTQEECRENCVGFKTGMDGAVVIDFSSIENYGTKTYIPISLNYATILDNNPTIANYILDKKKQDALTFDGEPISKSVNPVTSGGIFNAIRNAISPLINAGYLLGGLANKSDSAYTPTSKQMKVAVDEGQYPAYGNIVVNKGEICLLYYTNDEWGKLVIYNAHTLPLSDDWRFDRCVKELYLNFDYSEITRVRLIYAAETGSRWYNALYLYTSSGTKVLFSEEYTTQEDCVRHAKGMKWNYELLIGAIIDFSLLPVGTYNDFYPSFNGRFPSEIDSIHGMSTIWKNTEYMKSFFEKAICIGDSITEGNIYDYGKYMGVGLKSKLSYPAHLAKNTGWTCENAGESGITTLNWWNNKFADYNYSEYDIAFIALGTNGGLTDTVETDAPVGTSYEDYADTNTGRYCSIIEGIRAQNPNIVIALIVMPINYNSVTRDTIYAIAERYNLPVLDMTDNTYYNLLRTPSLHGKSNSTTSDLTHFNAIGYCVLAHCIMASFFNWCQSNYQYVNDYHNYNL